MKAIITSLFILPLTVGSILLGCSSKSTEPQVSSLEGHPYEDYTIELKASEILPKQLQERLQGDVYVVDENVTNIAGINRFKVTSDFGELIVDSNYLLQKRLNEFSAIAELHEISRGGAFVDAQVEAVKASVDVTVETIKHPINTVSKIPGGVLRLFKDGYKDVTGAVKFVTGQDQGDDLVADTIGTSDANRSIAKEYNVDPYTRNHILQNEMNRLALFMAPGKKAEEYTRKITQGGEGEGGSKDRIIWESKLVDLKERNKGLLVEMGVTEEIAEMLLENNNYIPSEVTHIVNTVDFLKTTDGFSLFMEVAAKARTIDEAVFYLRAAELMAAYHEKKGAVKKIQLVNLVPVMITQENKVIIISPVDYATIYRSDKKLISQFFENSKDLATANMELWTEGLISEQLKQELATRGITTVSQAFQKL